LNKEPHNYSWWSYRANAKQNNKGWRIDYHILTENLNDSLQNVSIMPEVGFSDHCPIVVELNR
jgi:exodeoxyribonuclease-3